MEIPHDHSHREADEGAEPLYRRIWEGPRREMPSRETWFQSYEKHASVVGQRVLLTGGETVPALEVCMSPPGGGGIFFFREVHCGTY